MKSLTTILLAVLISMGAWAEEDVYSFDLFAKTYGSINRD